MAIFVNKYNNEYKNNKWNNNIQHNRFDYFIIFSNYRNFQIVTGKNVAIKNDKNNSDCEINLGNISIGKIIPTNKLFEKSGLGNKRKPPISPTIIEIYAVFSFNCLL